MHCHQRNDCEEKSQKKREPAAAEAADCDGRGARFVAAAAIHGDRGRRPRQPVLMSCGKNE